MSFSIDKILLGQAPRQSLVLPLTRLEPMTGMHVFHSYFILNFANFVQIALELLSNSYVYVIQSYSNLLFFVSFCLTCFYSINFNGFFSVCKFSPLKIEFALSHFVYNETRNSLALFVSPFQPVDGKVSKLTKMSPSEDIYKSIFPN